MSSLPKLLGVRRAVERINADDAPGSSSALGMGMDLAITVLVFVGVGFVVDRWLGTKPIFMISLVLLAVIGQFFRMWYQYDASMKVLEAERAAKSQARGTNG